MWFIVVGSVCRVGSVNVYKAGNVLNFGRISY